MGQKIYIGQARRGIWDFKIGGKIAKIFACGALKNVQNRQRDLDFKIYICERIGGDLDLKYKIYSSPWDQGFVGFFFWDYSTDTITIFVYRFSAGW